VKLNWNVRKRRRKGPEEIFEVIMSKNVPKLMTDRNYKELIELLLLKSP
jgi:hypothetical protein